MQVLEEDSCEALAIISMLFAYASVPMELLTTVQVAEMRNEPKITWRKRAEIGKIPGAFKLGNLWLLERSVLQAIGVMRDVININPDEMWVDNQSGVEDAEQQISAIGSQQQ